MTEFVAIELTETDREMIEQAAWVQEEILTAFGIGLRHKRALAAPGGQEGT